MMFVGKTFNEHQPPQGVQDGNVWEALARYQKARQRRANLLVSPSDFGRE
jgi:hypothetical protein